MNARMMIALALVVGVVVALSLMRFEDPEIALVEATLRGLVECVEAGDAEGLSAYVAVDYSDRLAQDQRAAVKRVISEVEHIPNVRVEMEGLKVDVDETSRRATATFRPVLSGDVDSSLKKHPKFDFERGKRLIVRLRKHDGLYVVTRADIGYAFGAALQ
jgi:hypothetical protein